jgi:hypothetical protein
MLTELCWELSWKAATWKYEKRMDLRDVGCGQSSSGLCLVGFGINSVESLVLLEKLSYSAG